MFIFYLFNFYLFFIDNVLGVFFFKEEYFQNKSLRKALKTSLKKKILNDCLLFIYLFFIDDVLGVFSLKTSFQLQNKSPILQYYLKYSFYPPSGEYVLLPLGCIWPIRVGDIWRRGQTNNSPSTEEVTQGENKVQELDNRRQATAFHLTLREELWMDSKREVTRKKIPVFLLVPVAQTFSAGPPVALGRKEVRSRS